MSMWRLLCADAFFMHHLLFSLSLFFFYDSATTEIYTLSLHDALPISLDACARAGIERAAELVLVHGKRGIDPALAMYEDKLRSEEHTSELQSLRHLVCRLLLEKKKKKKENILKTKRYVTVHVKCNRNE